MEKQAFVLWFTGLSGAGKSTLAENLLDYLKAENVSARIIDGDDIRNEFHKQLGFTPEDITENNYLIAELCRKYQKDYQFLLVAVIAPFSQVRHEVRQKIGEKYREIYVKASLDEVIRRDVKGLYKRALKGEISNFVGVDANVPYEEPQAADLVLDTAQETIDVSLNKLIQFVKEQNNG